MIQFLFDDHLGWTIVGILVGLLGLGVFCNFQQTKSGNAFAAKMAQEYKTCRDKGETEYTCKAYVAAMEANRGAEQAQESAGIAAGAAGFAAGMAATR